MLKAGTDRKRWWDFLVTMTEREIKVRYKSSVLGIFWVVLYPIIQMLVIWFIFRFFTGQNTVSYMWYLFSGLIIWNFFSSSISRSTPAIINERYLLKKAVFPKESIVIAIVISNFLQFLLSLMIMFLLFFLNGYQINWGGVWWLPLGLVFLLMFTTGCCLFLSALNVRWRDINVAVNFLLSLWFYLSPVIYDEKMLPVGVYKFLYLNPMTGLMDFFRWCVFGNPLNNWNFIYLGMTVVMVFFVFGWIFFKKKSLYFDDWI